MPRYSTVLYYYIKIVRRVRKYLAEENMSSDDEARIVVLGSFMTDVIRFISFLHFMFSVFLLVYTLHYLFSYVKKLPKVGETLCGHKLVICCGGKGANQAVTAARLGASTAFIGKVTS